MRNKQPLDCRYKRQFGRLSFSLPERENIFSFQVKKQALSKYATATLPNKRGNRGNRQRSNADCAA